MPLTWTDSVATAVTDSGVTSSETSTDIPLQSCVLEDVDSIEINGEPKWWPELEAQSSLEAKPQLEAILVVPSESSWDGVFKGGNQIVHERFDR